MSENIPETLPDPAPMEEESPKWGRSTKALVSLTFLGLIAFFLIRFRNIVGPLLVAFLLVYLLYPVARWLYRKAGLSWNLAVAIVLTGMVLIVLGILLGGGLILAEQIKAFSTFLQGLLKELPAFLDNFNQHVIRIGPVQYPLSRLNVNIDTVGDPVAGYIQPLVGQLGTVVTSVAGGAVTVIGTLVFIIMVTFFILSENKGRPYSLRKLNIPGYEADIDRMVMELKRIWNGYIRGQLTMITITIVIYFVLLTLLGVRFVWALALMAGIARLIPWLGPAITWVVYFLVALLQGTTLFGLQPLPYAFLVAGVALFMDPVIDSVITPKIMGNALRIHPALLLIGIFVGTTWLGFIGLLLAGPVLATLKLFATYTLRKAFDLDPWEGLEVTRARRKVSLGKRIARVWRRIKKWCQKNWQKWRSKFKRTLMDIKKDG